MTLHKIALVLYKVIMFTYGVCLFKETTFNLQKYLIILFSETNIRDGIHEFLACRSRQASIVLEWYFLFEVSLLSFYACERDGPIRVSGGSDIIT